MQVVHGLIRGDGQIPQLRVGSALGLDHLGLLARQGPTLDHSAAAVATAGGLLHAAATQQHIGGIALT